MSRHNINIQDGFLFQSLKEARTMTFELITGQRIEGRLRRFDRFAGGFDYCLVNRSVCSLIAPARTVTRIVCGGQLGTVTVTS